eukprot:s303_g6.t1
MLRKLALIQAPLVLMQLVSMVFRSNGFLPENVHLVEYFAGDPVLEEVMVSRMTLVLYILQAKRVFWIYEQPSSSILWSHPRMEAFIRRFFAWRCHTWMGAYGAPSPKGTVLWGSRPSIKKMARNLPDKEWSANMTKKTTNSQGKTTVCGASDLKGSQAYTPEFGFATLDLWRNECDVDPLDLSKVQLPNFWVHQSKKDRWEDAELSEVMQYLSTN